MARKTKQEAALTRNGILDAAEQVFEVQGVAGTSLQDIADRAGVTRGAVYWHFKDKADVFNAMMERVSLPFEESSDTVDRAPPAQALQRLREHFAFLIKRTQRDAQLRRVLCIATQMVEYNAELAGVRQRRLQRVAKHIAMVERTLGAARKSGQLRPGVPLKQAALGLHALLDGLLLNWLLRSAHGGDGVGFDLQRSGLKAIDIYIAGLLAVSPNSRPVAASAMASQAATASVSALT